MKLPDEIKTITEISEVTTLINKSRFIAQVYPVFSEDEVKGYLAGVKKKYYDASHHCYAFKLADSSFRYSDAGEPNGTAGIRILNAIEHFNLFNQLIIVSRIFGGVKLGVGPLGKAYFQSALNVIDSSKISNKRLFNKATISTSYERISSIQRILQTHQSIIKDSEYKDTIKLTCLLRSSEVELVSKKIAELDRTNTSVIIQEETVYN
jgi:uncharacterized YigZ family protein